MVSICTPQVISVQFFLLPPSSSYHFPLLTVLAFLNELVNFLYSCSYFNLTINVKVIFCLTLLVCSLVD